MECDRLSENYSQHPKIGKRCKKRTKTETKVFNEFRNMETIAEVALSTTSSFLQLFQKKDRLKTASSYLRKSFRNRKKLHFRRVVHTSSIVNFNTKSNVLLNLRKRHGAMKLRKIIIFYWIRTVSIATVV